MDEQQGVGSGARSGMWLAGVLALAATSGPGSARAAHPMVTDDAGTLGRGVGQVELGTEVARDRADDPGGRLRQDAGEGAVTVGLGLHDRVDLAAGVGLGWARVRQAGATVHEEQGPGDVAVDLKWRLVERQGLALALKPGLTLPTGDEERGLGTGRVCWAVTAVATGELGPVALHANAGYHRDAYGRAEDRARSRADRVALSTAVSGEVARGLTLVADAGAETNPDRSSDTWPAYALAGAIWSVSERLDLDAGLKVGLTDPEPDLAGRLGITARF